MRVEAGSIGDLHIYCDEWPGFSLGSLRPAVEADGNPLKLTEAICSKTGAGTYRVDYDFSGVCRLNMEISTLNDAETRLKSRLWNASGKPLQVGRVILLEAGSDRRIPTFGCRADQIRMLEQSNHTGDIVPLLATSDSSDQPQTSEPDAQSRSTRQGLASQHVWVTYDRDAKQALLVGFESSERWTGAITVETDEAGLVLRWTVGFSDGDLLLAPGQEVALEDVLLLQGRDPLDLLDTYGDAAVHRHTPQLPPETPVSWCSWYAYRLGVSEERMLETARIAASRLKPLGLRIIQADLGWEKEYLPNSFEENGQFPQGFKWLSEELEKMGFQLGCWNAPYQISEFDSLAREHPEWLIPDEDGNPAAIWTWFWQPYGNVYALDLTHPGAQQWLRTQIRGLAERGVKYLKADFIAQPDTNIVKRRLDRRIAAGAETARIGARIIREELPEALILNCGGMDMPGTGQWPLLYACRDTGNTGVITWDFQKINFRTLACHLWKNRRWGIILGSCLCVGLPGTLEEARIRATAAFLSGGQIDISDTLVTLPEDRWAVLEATLPPLGLTARAIDLFDPVYDPGSVDYETSCKGETEVSVPRPHSPGSVWHLRVRETWDEWDIVAVYVLESDGDRQSPKRFRIPLDRLGLDPANPYWAYEFWSGQFLGAVPSRRLNPGGYEHPGDMQDLTVGDADNSLEIAFTGPAVKLLSLRAMRPHPWVVGTSFHQSCGAELEDVAWNPETGILSGRLNRPAGHGGNVIVAGAGWIPESAAVSGQSAVLLPTANGGWKLPVNVNHHETRWSIQFAAGSTIA